MSDTTEATAQRTNLAVPSDLARRIMSEAAADLRSYKAEILTLLGEALAARDKARGGK